MHSSLCKLSLCLSLSLSLNPTRQDVEFNDSVICQDIRYLPQEKGVS